MSALHDLVDICRHLPGESDRTSVVRPRPETGPATGKSAPRRETAAFLAALGSRLERQLLDALVRAGRAWDQVDACVVVDDGTRAAAAALIKSWQAAGGAEAAVAVLTIETVLSLGVLLERRLAVLVRLRLRSDPPDLIVGGRPFLDVPRALLELSRRWS